MSNYHVEPAARPQALTKEAEAPPKPQNVVSPDEALDLLMKGNARYVAGVSRRHDFKNEREALVGGQNPYAGILSCADSRIAPEYAFDSARGDLFVGRVAGNFANDDLIASFEYAAAILKTPLFVVLGHERCGAVRAYPLSATLGTWRSRQRQQLYSFRLTALWNAPYTRNHARKEVVQWTVATNPARWLTLRFVPGVAHIRQFQLD